jgi:hypothetical protein
MIKKTKSQIAKLKRMGYCNHCREYCMPTDERIKNCVICNTKLKYIYKEDKNG